MSTKNHNTERYTMPASDAPGEEWGRLAISIPDWRWLPGALDQKNRRYHVTVPHELCDAVWPDPDDPATEGCLLRLLGHGAEDLTLGDLRNDGTWAWLWWDGESWRSLSLGRACIAAAAAIGRWPGGAA